MAFRDAVLADSPLAYYEFSETSGTAAADSSGNAHGGTYQGAPTLNQASAVGKAVKFASASSQDVLLDTLGALGSNLSTCSVEFIIKTTSTAGPQAIYGTVNTGTSMILAAYLNADESENFSAGKTCFHYRDSTNHGLRASISTNIYDGNEHHVVVVVTSNASIAVYVDGVAQTVTYQVGNTTLSSYANLGFGMTVAARNVRGTLDRYADMTLSELAFYTTQLSSTRVSAHYAAISGLGISGAGGIASAGAFGTPTIGRGAVTISPSGIASAGAFGTPTVTLGAVAQTISPSGIASAGAFGTPTVTVGAAPVVISPTSILSGEVFGDPVVQLGPAPVVVTVGAGPGGGLDWHVTGLWYPDATTVPYYGRIADPDEGEVVIPLNDSRTAGVTVSLYDPIIRDLQGHTYARCLRVYYHGHLIFWGPCKLIDIDMAAGTARLTAMDPTVRLIRHYLRRGDLNGDLNASNDDRYPVSVDAVGLRLLRDAALNIAEQTARGVPDLGIIDGLNYYPASPADLIGVARGDEVFNAMVQLCNSLGPDMEFEPIEDTVGAYCRLNTWRTQGSDKSNRVQLHWGTGRDNLTNLTTQEGAKYTTHAHILSRDLRYRFTEADLETSADTGPYVDWNPTDYDAHGITAANVERVLRAFGDDILNAYSTPLRTYALDLPPEDDGSYMYLQDYRVGDLVDVAGRAGEVNVEGTCRITTVTLRQTGSNGGVQPELAVVPHRDNVFGDHTEEA